MRIAWVKKISKERVRGVVAGPPPFVNFVKFMTISYVSKLLFELSVF